MIFRLRRLSMGGGPTRKVARSNGFTLIELMVSLAILASLAAALLPMTELMARRSQEQALKEGLRDIRSAIDAYKQASDDGEIAKVLGATGYPADLSVLVSGVPDKANLNGGKRIFLRSLPHQYPDNYK